VHRGFFLALAVVTACEPPASDDVDEDGVLAADDCDDQDAAVGEATTWYPDCDGDGVAAPAGQDACEAPTCTGGSGTWRGADEPHDDCDDADPDAVAPTAWHADCDGDGTTGDVEVSSCGIPTTSDCAPLAGDWLDTPSPVMDCNDADATVTASSTWYVDCDADGAPSDETAESCGEPADPPCDLPIGEWADTPPPTYDCDDRDPRATAERPWYVDCDLDGVPSSDAVTGCARPSDDDATDLCGAPIANWTDHAPAVLDCDDFDDSLPADWRIDCDGDGRYASGVWGGCEDPTTADATAQCGASGVDWVYCSFVDPPFPDECIAGVDCDDADASGGDPPTWRPDCDGDGYPSFFGVPSCEPPPSVPICSGNVPLGGWLDSAQALIDCQDQLPGVSPGATEILGNNVDDDCDPLTPDVGEDIDGDGFSPPEDCDDDNDSTYPGANDDPGDGEDSDCDGYDIAAPGPDDLWVAVWGDDASGNGSQEAPFATIRRASFVAAVNGNPDAVIRVARGTYADEAARTSVIGGYLTVGTVWTWDPTQAETLLEGAGPDADALLLQGLYADQRVQLVAVTLSNDRDRALSIDDDGVDAQYELTSVVILGEVNVLGGTGTVFDSTLTNNGGDAFVSEARVGANTGTWELLETSVHASRYGVWSTTTSPIVVEYSGVSGGSRGVSALGSVRVWQSTVTSTQSGGMGVEVTGSVASIDESTIIGGAAAVRIASGGGTISRSTLTGGVNTLGPSAGLSLSGAEVVVATAMVRGGGDGTTPSSVGVLVADGSELLGVASLFEGGSAPAVAGARVETGSGATFVNSMLASGPAVSASPANAVVASRDSTVRLDHVHLDRFGTGLVRIFGGSLPDLAVSTSVDVEACTTWAPVCQSAVTVFDGPLGLNLVGGEWYLSATSPAVNHGRDPTSFGVNADFLGRDLLGRARPFGGVYDVGPIEYDGN
jgi:hypothetical protein